MADIGTLTPEQYQQQQLNRQQKMAELLMAQGSQGQPAGQMVSGRYVPNSWAQNLLPVAQMLTGAYLGKKGDEESLKLAEQLRQKQATEAQGIIGALQGTPATYGADIPTETYETVKGQMLTPAVAGDANKALSMALQSQTGIGKALIPTLAERAIPKPLQPTADIQNYEFAKTTGFKGSFNDFKNQLTLHQQEQLKIDREKLGIDLQKLNLDRENAEQEIKFGKPLTEVQGNATAFGMRAKQSDAILKDLESKGVTNTGIIRSAVGGTLGLTPFVGEKLERCGSTTGVGGVADTTVGTSVLIT